MDVATSTTTGRAHQAVRVTRLGRRFGERTVLTDLDLEIGAGEFIALLGTSGCGKSTLAKILAGLDTDFTGEVMVAQRRAVGFQAPRLMPWMKVWRNVVLGLPGRPDRGRALDALAEVGLESHADVWPKTLSGGEAQRVSLARSLVRAPDLLLLDEPFAALDALSRVRAQDLVLDLWRRHRPAVLLVTHDIDEALRLADRVLVMRSGGIAYEARIDSIRPRDIADPELLALRRELPHRLTTEHQETPR